MHQNEYLESVLVEKSTIPGRLIGFVTDIKLFFNIEIEYYGLYREEKSRFYRKIKIIKKSPYITLNSEPSFFVGKNEGYLLIIWLTICFELFLGRKLGNSRMIRQVRGTLDNASYVFDFSVFRNQKPGTKGERDLQNVVIGIQGKANEPTVTVEEEKIREWSVEFNVDDASIMLALLRKAQHVMTP